MNILIVFLSILAVFLVWILCGFLGFLIEVKKEGFTKFDSKEKEECTACVLLGGIALIWIIICCIRDWFIRFMNTVLWRMNHKK